MADLGRLEERWDIYYHQFHLHTCLNSESYWYKSTWWFPDHGRNEDIVHMFVASRWGPIDELKYYDMYLPDGSVLENVML